jgi:protein TonB
MHARADQLRDANGPPDPALIVDVVVLSGDLPLFQAIRDAVGERNPVWRARTAEESVDLLMTGRCGVLLIDMGAVSAQPGSLVQQITDQFPDVVIVVAGRRDDESLLAELVSDGLVYRFMHKPLSPKRAGMFLDAAIRSHVERRSGRPAKRLLLDADERQTRFDARKWAFVGGGLLLFLLLLAAVLVTRNLGSRETAAEPVGAREPARAANAGPLADPVLSRARAAFAAGRDESPPGRNALDLYAAVLLARPDNAEARDGLAETTARLVARAEAAAASGDRVEAQRIVARVLGANPDNSGALALRALLATPAAPAEPAPVAQPPMENPAGTSAAPPTEPPAPRASTSTRAIAPGAPLRVPVTTSPARETQRPVPVTRSQVPPDPLLSGAGRSVPGMTPWRPVYRHRYHAPATAGHAIAGPAPREPAALPTAGMIEPQTPSAEAAPVAVASRDLEAIATPDPAYPPEAFRARVEGWVEVEFTVDAQGAATDVAVVASEPRGVFDAAASEAVAAWRYRPRVVNGRPTAQRTSVTLYFNVED